ncbi:MAG: hypothetical protein HUU01_11000 [Saprospiraceae bacterium]|nr:hypothetical protein [Saprospiraceae bacterium]
MKGVFTAALVCLAACLSFSQNNKHQYLLLQFYGFLEDYCSPDADNDMIESRGDFFRELFLTPSESKIFHPDRGGNYSITQFLTMMRADHRGTEFFFEILGLPKGEAASSNPGMVVRELRNGVPFQTLKFIFKENTSGNWRIAGVYQFSDRDGDLFKDEIDQCPDQAGPLKGCPDNPLAAVPPQGPSVAGLDQCSKLKAGLFQKIATQKDMRKWYLSSGGLGISLLGGAWIFQGLEDKYYSQYLAEPSQLEGEPLYQKANRNHHAKLITFWSGIGLSALALSGPYFEIKRSSLQKQLRELTCLTIYSRGLSAGIQLNF